MDKTNASSLVVVLTLITVIVGGYLLFNSQKIFTKKIGQVEKEVNLNSSDDITATNNSDGTMGPSSWQYNFSNNLPDSAKGKLIFYITDPPGNPPGLDKKNPTKIPTITSIISPSVTVPTVKATVTPVVPTFPPGKTAKLESLVIEINKIEVHRSVSGKSDVSAAINSGRWETLNIGTTLKTVDLMELADKSLDLLLGTTSLEAGHYTEIRLYVKSAQAKYDDGGMVELEIPGKNNIVRVVRQFSILADETTKLTLDFNAPKSIVITKDKYILKPVIARLIVERMNATITPAK